jgi:hypothetical protein
LEDGAATYVLQHLFDKKQFVTDKELMFSDSHQVWCAATSIPVMRKRAQIFWDERKGKETVKYI